MAAHRSNAQIVIAAAERQGFALTATHGITVGLAQAQVTISRATGPVSAGDPVRVRMGLDYALADVFNGRVNDRGIDYYPTYYQLQCSGRLKAAMRRINLKNPACYPPPDPDLPTPDPVAYCATSKTDGEIVADLLALVGLSGDIEDAGVTLGVLNPVQLPTGGSPWALIQEIDKRTFMRTFDAPDGTILRRSFTVLPTSSAAITLTEGVDIFDLKPTQTLDGMITNVHVKGASYVGTDDVPITIEFSTDEPEPNEYDVADTLEWTSDLFESEEDAEAWARTALGEYGKLQERIQGTLSPGKTNLRGGMTVAIVSPTMGYGAGSRFVIEEVRQYFDGVEFLTGFTARGAAVPEGASANKSPHALFTYRIHHEGSGAGELDGIYLDGSMSYDEDGLIASWVWASNHGTPTPMNGGKQAVLINSGGAIPGDLTVTLTVTDDQGRTGTLTKAIVTDADHPVEVRDLWIAASTSLKLCTDGETWEDIAIAAVGVAREADSTYNLAWTSGGALYRVLIDKTSTLLSPTGITAASITYDAAGLFTGEAYAGASDGKVYRGTTNGTVWALQGTIPGGAAVQLISAILGTPGGVQALSGAALWESFDQGATWIKRKEHSPSSGVTAQDFAAGFGKGFIGFAGSGSGADFVQERDNLVSIAFPSGDPPVQVAAVTMEGESPVLFVLGAKSGTGKSYIGNVEDGGELVPGAWNTGRDGLPNDGFRDSRTDGLVYVGATKGLIKTLDEFASTYRVLAAAGSENFLKIGVGALHAQVQDTVIVSAVGLGKVKDMWNGSSNDASPAGYTAIPYDDAAWASSILLTGGIINDFYQLPPGAAWITTVDGFASDHEFVHRRLFTLPAGVIKSATLVINTDDDLAELAINGTDLLSLYIRTTGSLPIPYATITIDPAILQSGQQNILSARIINSGGTMAIGYRLTVRLQ